jgi:phenylacetate-CoA ligase
MWLKRICYKQYILRAFDMATNLLTQTIAGVVFPLHEKLKGHDSVARLRALEQSQWWKPEQLRAHQTEKLRAFLTQIGATVPYYRQIFQRLNFDPASISNVRDLARLPLLTKALIRGHTEELKSRAAGPLKRYNTGGSSGEPLVFFMGKDRVSHDVASKWRATRWWNVDIGDPEIVIWGSPIEVGAQDRVRNVRDKIFRTQLLPAFQMSEAKLDEFVAHIRRARPRMLFGYPSALAHIARHARARSQRMDDLGIRVAFVTSERLYDEQRKIISETFGCPVANGYGGRDAGFIAHECPSGGMHLTAEDIIVEIVDEQGKSVPNGTPGEIVITHMATGDFPFVRYRTGDVATLSDAACACGRGLPLVQEIQGRTTDFVVAADGTVMHGLALIYILRDLAGIKQFKIVQESLARTQVLLVTAPEFDTNLLPRIVSGFKARLGKDVEIALEQVAEIAPERSGKHRYVVSKVART